MTRFSRVLAATAVLFALAACERETPTTTGDGGRGAPPAVTESPQSTSDDDEGGPTLGKYLCYQVPSYAYTGYFTLEAGGQYTPFQGSKGKYRYDSSSRVVAWVGGVYDSSGWEAVHLPEGFEDRKSEALVIRDKGDTRAPGTEPDYEFQYCYLSEDG